MGAIDTFNKVGCWEKGGGAREIWAWAGGRGGGYFYNFTILLVSEHSEHLFLAFFDGKKLIIFTDGGYPPPLRGKFRENN